MRTIFWLNGLLVRALCVLGVLLVAAMMLGISAEVILRLFGFPSIVGMIELTEYALFISTFFMAPYLLRTNEHIRVDLVIARIDPSSARYMEVGILVAVMLVSVVTGVIATILMMRSYHDGTLVFKDLIFPQWWLDWIIPITSLALFLQALEMLVDLIRHPNRHVPPMHEQVPGVRPEEMP